MQLFPQQIHLDTASVKYLKLNMFTTEPLIILHKPFSLSCAHLCKLQLLLTKNLRLTFTLLSHKFHTQLISKSYSLYLQNRYQTRLLLTTSTATILVQPIIMLPE